MKLIKNILIILTLSAPCLLPSNPQRQSCESSFPLPSTITNEALSYSLAYIFNLNILPSSHLLYISIPHNTTFHFINGYFHKAYISSSSIRPPSCIENSLGTPSGLHKICQKIGHNQPLGMVFESRLPINKSYPQYAQEKPGSCFITSRILRLQGLEDNLNHGSNHDTYNRYVYIHGTGCEAQIGQPLSNGCILLTNPDIIELFDSIPENSLVLIDPSPLPSLLNNPLLLDQLSNLHLCRSLSSPSLPSIFK